MYMLTMEDKERVGVCVEDVVEVEMTSLARERKRVDAARFFFSGRCGGALSTPPFDTPIGPLFLRSLFPLQSHILEMHMNLVM